ncbi:MAG: hypothetical protein ABFD69_14570 [Candidatus Sumerlaeia bacterium]
MTEMTRTLQVLEQATELWSGKKADVIRKQSIEERRQEAEAKLHKKLRIVRLFPFIGRGNILRDRVAESGQINKDLEKALKNVR